MRGRSGDGATAASSWRPNAARSSPTRCWWRRTATRTAWRPDSAADHADRQYIIASEPLPEDLARELSPTGRAFWDTKYFLYYWHVSADRRMIFGGRTSFLPTSVDRSAAILHRGLLRGPPAARGLPHRVRVGRQCRLHVRPDAARGPDVRRRHLCRWLLGTGVALMTGLGTQVGGWLAGDPAPALTKLGFPLVSPRRTRATRGSCRSSASGIA